MSQVYSTLTGPGLRGRGLGSFAQDACQFLGAGGGIIGMLGGGTDLTACREQCQEKLTGAEQTRCLSECAGGSQSTWSAIATIGSTLSTLCASPTAQDDPAMTAHIAELEAQLAAETARLERERAAAAEKKDTWIPGVPNAVVMAAGGIAILAVVMGRK